MGKGKCQRDSLLSYAISAEKLAGRQKSREEMSGSIGSLWNGDASPAAAGEGTASGFIRGNFFFNSFSVSSTLFSFFLSLVFSWSVFYAAVDPQLIFYHEQE